MINEEQTQILLDIIVEHTSGIFHYNELEEKLSTLLKTVMQESYETGYSHGYEYAQDLIMDKNAQS